jgi:hypothetical protein
MYILNYKFLLTHLVLHLFSSILFPEAYFSNKLVMFMSALMDSVNMTTTIFICEFIEYVD